MRFILNFIFFGILFYLIYLFFPDAFKTLVSWANQAYEYFRDLFSEMSGKVQKKEQGIAVYYEAILGFLKNL